MLAHQRREKIIDLLTEDGSAKVINLAKLFKVTEVTIRQDLEKLEHEGLVTREHGGVYLKNVVDHVRDFSLVHQENMDKKEAIARKCMEFIESGDTIILDSGSTTTEIAKKNKGDPKPDRDHECDQHRPDPGWTDGNRTDRDRRRVQTSDAFVNGTKSG